MEAERVKLWNLLLLTSTFLSFTLHAIVTFWSASMTQKNTWKQEGQQPYSVMYRNITLEKYLLHTKQTVGVSSDFKQKGWKCCIDPEIVNPIPEHPAAELVQARDYRCERKSNFSLFYEETEHDPPIILNASKWKNRSILFAGGSTSRQMLEQLRWEMPQLINTTTIHHDMAARFLFLHRERSCCWWNGSMTLDMRYLSPGIEKALDSGYQFIILNVGTWWSSNSIGSVIDENAMMWHVDGRHWRILNSTNHTQLPDVSFDTMMRNGLVKMLKRKKPNTTIVWRSETFTDCPPGSGERKGIEHVLKELHIPILNISEATCAYVALDIDDSRIRKYPHLCFPSVALRHWLQMFQNQFL